MPTKLWDPAGQGCGCTSMRILVLATSAAPMGTVVRLVPCIDLIVPQLDGRGRKFKFFPKQLLS